MVTGYKNWNPAVLFKTCIHFNIFSSPFFLYNLGKGGGLLNLINFKDLLRHIICSFPENLFVYTYYVGMCQMYVVVPDG